ncbi:trypsin-like [Toxorhynchites rutilus septentrionalis]|uniref:trypsin-like n=1 Tax=Toxorhynchites rutilus septentrionalis TaxID=329112 RepID=UPI00247996E0|nr:trypsin-like [Toxorhynchites rutilus septentrionalis]
MCEEFRPTTVIANLLILVSLASRSCGELFTAFGDEDGTIDPFFTEATPPEFTEYDSEGVTPWLTRAPYEYITLIRVLNCTQCECGRTESVGKIVGGKVTEESHYPWMAALYYNNRFTCGGSLVSDRYVLTAAHCVYRLMPARFRVQLLVHNRSKPTTKSVERSVKAIRTIFYNSVLNNNDIALLELTFPVSISSERLVPVCLPQPNDNTYEGKTGIVTGWGRTAAGVLSDTLQELRVPILSNARCRRLGYWSFQITNKMLCAGYVQGGRDSCQGDSGGPLHVYNNQTKRHEIVGVVSWGRGCAESNYPGVYARVNKFQRWIKNTIRDSCTCN